MPKIYLTPWMHLIEDDFLPSNLLRQLLEIKLCHVKKDSILISKNSIGKDLDLKCSNMMPELVSKIHQNCFPRLWSYLQALAPKKCSYYDYSVMHIVQTGSEYSFKIHDDIPRKLLSVVVYLSPSQSSGTSIYTTNDKASFSYETLWKVNRALIFSRKKDVTWHSYSGHATGERLTLVYNLMSNATQDAIESCE